MNSCLRQELGCQDKALPTLEDGREILDQKIILLQVGQSPTRRHSISGSNDCAHDVSVITRRQSDNFVSDKDLNADVFPAEKTQRVTDRSQLLIKKYDFGRCHSSKSLFDNAEPCKIATSDVEKRTLRVPNPPPRRSVSNSLAGASNGSGSKPPPPPPPPPAPKFSTRSTGVMKRAPQVAELYHSLMKRDLRRDSSSGGNCEQPSNAAEVRSSMIGEIENRSSHLLAIKADVETQGEFVKSLIKEVNEAVYLDIEDVVAFVKWLDDELGFLVDERAVLKHFDWPERKADTLQEAAFGYRDLKKLESEISNYKDNPCVPCDIAQRKMIALSEK